MVKLAKREEQIMQVFWDLQKAFIRDAIPLLPGVFVRVPVHDLLLHRRKPIGNFARR
jgi:hypothetical protein